MRIKKSKKEEVVETPVVQEEPKKPDDTVKVVVNSHIDRLKKKHGK